MDDKDRIRWIALELDLRVQAGKLRVGEAADIMGMSLFQYFEFVKPRICMIEQLTDLINALRVANESLKQVDRNGQRLGSTLADDGLSGLTLQDHVDRAMSAFKTISEKYGIDLNG